MSKIDEILDDRNKKYGSYIDQAQIACALRQVVHRALVERQNGLAADQMDAIVMVFCKVSRIVNGDPDYADNWRDIAGYATLVADRLEGKVR